MLIGPPGTGKTTTLIKRLGQKIDTYDGQSLSDSEGAIVKRLEEDTGLDHSENWLMFTPTELLKQYLKEAFTKERVPAGNKHISTWSSYQKTLKKCIGNTKDIE